MTRASGDLPAKPNRLVLWDVDHTLIEARGVGGELFAEAFQAVTGRPMETMAPLAGRTEPVIMSETLELHGIDPTDDLLAALFDALAALYEERIDLLRARGRALPGALESLTALAANDEVVSSVLTGNLQRVALTKLTAFGLADLVDLDAGAFGSDDSDRVNLVLIARARATDKYGIAFPPDATALVGDTPNDVLAGLRTGSRVLGVASGKNSVDELLAAGAHIVIPDLINADDVLKNLFPTPAG